MLRPYFLTLYDISGILEGQQKDQRCEVFGRVNRSLEPDRGQIGRRTYPYSTLQNGIDRVFKL
jgi:hypothetical protein